MRILEAWTVKRRDGRGTRSRCMARCDCGDVSEYDKNNIDRGNTTRCKACAEKSRAKKRRTHGASYTRRDKDPEMYATYTIWQAMKRRCRLESDVSYKHYGGRGIRVCKSWQDSFESFLSDMGVKPSKSHEIDRIDCDGDYSPENCRWVTRKVNARNKRNTVYLTIDGETKPMVEWAEISGESASNIKNRVVNLGWTHKQAVFGKSKKRVYNTPIGKFNTLEEVSVSAGVCISTASRRFKSSAFKEWFISEGD